MAYGNANMHNTDMECNDRSKAVPKIAFFSHKKGQTASIDKATMACKNRGQKRGIEASGIYKIQTAKYPSTTLNRDQK